MAISWTVVMVLPSSGTLTFLLLDNDPLRCQNGTLSGKTAVSLSEVEDRPTDSAASLSEELLAFDSPTGLFADGHSWYLEAVGWTRFASDVLFTKGTFGALESLAAWRSLSEHDRRGRW